MYATNAWTSLILPELKDIIKPRREHFVSTSRIKPLCKNMQAVNAYWDFSNGNSIHSIRLDDGPTIFGNIRYKTDDGIYIFLFFELSTNKPQKDPKFV